jgi:NADH-quinone oxidoreductase subunit L
MGGLSSRMKLTFVTFTIGVAAIIGLPFLAGFFSKDAILYLAYTNNKAVFAILAFTAILTALYMTRLWRLTFFGEPRSESAAHAHEGGLTLTLPLIVLAVLAAIGGYVGFYPKVFTGVFELIPEAHGSDHTTILITSLVVLILGAGTALMFYRPASNDALEDRSPGLFRLLASKLWFDEIYQWYIDKVQQRFALLLNFLEQIFLAGLIVRGAAGVVGLFGLGARALHVGKLSVYVYWFLAGVVVLWLFATGVF